MIEKYSNNVWYSLEIKYKCYSNDYVQICYSIDNTFLGCYTFDKNDSEDKFKYLQLVVQEGYARFDDIELITDIP